MRVRYTLGIVFIKEINIGSNPIASTLILLYQYNAAMVFNGSIGALQALGAGSNPVRCS